MCKQITVLVNMFGSGVKQYFFLFSRAGRAGSSVAVTEAEADTIMHFLSFCPNFRE